MEEDDIVSFSPTFRGNIYASPQERMDWRLYLTEMGDDPRNHLEAIDMIREAHEEDTIEILITCPGGRVDTADMYLSAMRDCKAKIITRAIGDVSSAATSIFLAGDERVCDEGSYFMFHNVQFGGMGGDSANVFSRTRFYERYFKDKFYESMSEVLTKEELEELFDRAGEVYLTGPEMTDRLEKAERRMEINETFGSEFLPGSGLVKMPFPEMEVKSAEDFPYGDEFDITLDEGYKKTFRLSVLSPKDFDEYNLEEVIEIGEAFSICLKGLNRREAIEFLIDEIQNGGGEE